MLFYKNLHSLFFNSYPHDADHFLALSGFVGPDPIRELSNLPFKSDVIFGLYKESPKRSLHEQLLTLHGGNTSILYSEILCHSKCYLWLKDNTPVRGLIGSANFSTSGLRNDYKETLFDIDQRQLYPLKGYIELIMGSAKACTEYRLEDVSVREHAARVVGDPNKCDMVLYDPDTGQVQNTHGLNWGMNERNHTRRNDACIPVRASHIRQYPNLFPPKQPQVEGRKRQNEIVEVVWDDKKMMNMLFEGTMPVDGRDYPKQISSHPHKDDLGKYIRSRIGVAEGQPVTHDDLRRYGRDSISVSLLEEGVYYFDFSVQR